MQFISTPFSWIVTLMNERVSVFITFYQAFRSYKTVRVKFLRLKPPLTEANEKKKKTEEHQVCFNGQLCGVFECVTIRLQINDS